MRGASQRAGTIRPGDVELWLLDCDGQAEALGQIEDRKRLLPASEHRRAGLMRDPTDARRWLSGRIALRLLIESRVGAQEARSEFVIAPDGRPSLASDALDFSLSDSDATLLIGLSRAGRIGVDIETLRPVAMSEVRAARLVAAANGLAGDRARPLGAGDIIAAWTRIEAFAKATAPSLAACLSALGTAGHVGHPETGEELRAHAAHMRDSAAVAVADLSLDGGLIGAVAVPSAAAEFVPEVRTMIVSALEP